MFEKPEAIQFADDRPTSTSDDLYQWAIDAEAMIRRQHAEIERLRKSVKILGRAPVVPQDVEKLREELAKEADAAKNWRRLALQFDNHRMTALGHLKCVLDPKCTVDGAMRAVAFLNAPPLDGEAVLAQRIAVLTAAPQPPEAEPVQMPEAIGELLDSRQDDDGLLSWYTENRPPVGSKLYTELQVRQILAAHGITN